MCMNLHPSTTQSVTKMWASFNSGWFHGESTNIWEWISSFLLKLKGSNVFSRNKPTFDSIICNFYSQNNYNYQNIHFFHSLALSNRTWLSIQRNQSVDIEYSFYFINHKFQLKKTNIKKLSTIVPSNNPRSWDPLPRPTQYRAKRLDREGGTWGFWERHGR
jgi:hypothetical protein